MKFSKCFFVIILVSVMGCSPLKNISKDISDESLETDMSNENPNTIMPTVDSNENKLDSPMQNTSEVDMNDESANVPNTGFSESKFNDEPESTSDQDEKGERIFIELNHLDSIENVTYKMINTFIRIDSEDDFTWWNHYPIDRYLSTSAAEYYAFDLPNELDSTKYDLIISFGRKLQYLYYYESDYIYYAASEGYRARPVFEEEFIRNSAYIYLINKTPLMSSELASEDLSKFMDGDIPVELPLDD